MLNHAGAELSFTVPSYTSLTANNIQFIINSKATLTKADEFFNKFTVSGGKWKLYTDNSNGAFLDVTETAGTFAITKENTVAVAYNTETKQVVFSKNRELVLSDGSWEVSAATDTSTYALLDKKIIALENGSVDLNASDINVYSRLVKSGKTFIGWKYENGSNLTMNGTTVALNKGDVIVAAYADIDPTATLTAEGVQIRNSGSQGLRFVFRSYASLVNTLKENNVTFKDITDTYTYYGVIINSTKETGGKDMFVDDGVSQKVMGLKTYAIGTNTTKGDFTEYTVMIESANSNGALSTAQFTRNYSVQGYIEYIDINGVERVAYSDYMQSSHYNAAAAVENYYRENQKTMSEELAAMIDEVKTYAEETREDNYYNAYLKNQTSVTNLDGLAGLTALEQGDSENPYTESFDIYELSNGFRYLNFDFSWYYVNTDENDFSTATELIQQTDHHLNYFSYKDFAQNREIVLRANENLSSESINNQNLSKAMDFSSWANKVILTGDMLNAPTLGSIQVLNRLITKSSLNRENILTVLGENDISFDVNLSVTDDKTEAYYRELLSTEGVWKNGVDFDYHAEIVRNDNGKNPVYVVTMNNSGGYYTTEQATQFKATITEAKTLGIPVIVYQHKAIAPNDGSDIIYYVGGKKGDSLGITEGFAASETSNKEMYALFTDYAEVIMGIFCGDDHSIAYTEINGTGRSEGLSIPQLIAPAAYLDNGWAVKVNVTAAEATAYTANMAGFDEENIVLTFPVLSDIHLSGTDKEEASTYQKFAEAVSITTEGAVNTPDLVAVAGDLVNATWEHASGAASTATEIRERANLLSAISDNVMKNGISFLSSYGNHDTGVKSGLSNPSSTEQLSKLFMDDVFAKTEEYADYFFANDVGYTDDKTTYLTDEQVLRGNRHAVYNGYHFLTLAELNSTGGSQDLAWLDAVLEEITSQNSNQTVFVLSHYRPSGLTYASNEDSENGLTTRLKNILEKYPQVITFGGHTHTYVEFENAIMQDESGFISIDCGGLQAADQSHLIGVDGAASGTKNCTNANADLTRHSGLLAEVDKDGNIRISRYDFRYNRKVGNDWIIPAVKSDGSRDLLYTKDRGNTDAPTFTVGSLTAEREDTTLTVTFPKAVSKTQVVQSYAVTVTEQGSNTPITFTYVPATNKNTTKETATAYITSDFYKYTKFTMPSSYTETFVIGQTTDTTGKYTINLAADKSYIVKVIARDSWGNQTAALETTLAAIN